jgi:hypothetical protein
MQSSSALLERLVGHVLKVLLMALLQQDALLVEIPSHASLEAVGFA